jgi:hypothetical protein
MKITSPDSVFLFYIFTKIIVSIYLINVVHFIHELLFQNFFLPDLPVYLLCSDALVCLHKCRVVNVNNKPDWLDLTERVLSLKSRVMFLSN